MARREPGRRWWKGALAALVLLACVGAFLVRRPDCRPSPAEAQVVSVLEGEGDLRVGAARRAFQLPPRVARAGYPAPHVIAETGATPPEARPGAEALVFEAGDLRLALLSLDLLLIPESLRDALREGAPEGLELVVVASHTHSGPGGFDARRLAGLAGTGWPQPRVQEDIVRAGLEALALAREDLRPARLSWHQGPAPEGLNRTRTDGIPASQSFSVLQMETAERTHSLVLVAAHPTLADREGNLLDADYPGRVQLDPRGGITLVLQGAGGNASVPPGPAPEVRIDQYAQTLEKAARRLVAAQSTLELHRGAASDVAPAVGAQARPASAEQVPSAPDSTWAPSRLRLTQRRVRRAVPGPDAGRLVPWFARGGAERLLCGLAPVGAELTVWNLGPVRLLFVPAEITAAVEPQLLEAAEASALVSLADGYLGYVEAPSLVRASRGEGRRQLFDPAFASWLTEAAAALGDADARR